MSEVRIDHPSGDGTFAFASVVMFGQQLNLFSILGLLVLFGVIKKGAYADILLVDGDPTRDIRLLMDSENIDLIMKDGVIYKNEL